jgi:hypothetical protein
VHQGVGFEWDFSDMGGPSLSLLKMSYHFNIGDQFFKAYDNSSGGEFMWAFFPLKVKQIFG